MPAAQPNNSFNRNGNSQTSFARLKAWCDYSRARLIRAFGASISPRQLMHMTLPSFKSRIDEIKWLVLWLQVPL